VGSIELLDGSVPEHLTRRPWFGEFFGVLENRAEHREANGVNLDKEMR